MDKNTYCIIMAGGPGSRFWPMSREDNPKQFLDILGRGESMLQTTFHRFERICPRENIVIVTSELYADRVREQIPGLLPYQVLQEPVRRNTAPCIAYAASVLHSMNPEANVIVSPSDHAVFDDTCFDRNLKQALAITAQHDWIVTIGVRPTNPDTKYGYIQFDETAALPTDNNLHRVVTFTEKPPVEVARQFIATGEFFWNSGIFVWRLPVLMQAYRTHLPNIAQGFFTLTANTPVSDVERLYSLSEVISVDFGIMEKADNIYMLEASFGWSDVESWDSLYATHTHDTNGNAFVAGKVFAYDTRNTVVHMQPHRTVILQGLEGYIVAENEDTLLICRRDQEDRIVKFASDVELAQLTAASREKKKI